jgi:hypothetical protein
MSKGEMQITILDDGTIKCETDDMSGAAHKAADDFLKMVARLAGGTVSESKRPLAHLHQHTHEHDHDHRDHHHEH